jgi:lysylphosphatidylglycerol synthetase-like protein (DUF2156 family)
LSPHWVDAVIAFTLLEGLWLWRRGWPVHDWAWNWASGLALMAALRGAIAGWGPAWVLGGIALAGAIHAADLWQRQARRSRSGMRTSQTMP